MNDDWRLRVDLHEDGFAHRLGEQLAAEELEHDLKRSFNERVVVSVDGSEVFLYAGTRDQAERAQQVVRALAEKHGWTVDLQLARWHPTAERWEDPEDPLPSTPDETAQELEQRVEVEREESAEQGYPEYEVRVHCTGREEAAELSRKLEAEGIPNLHRWSYVLIGVADETAAAELAKRIQGEVPPGSQVVAELNPRVVYENRPFSPFSVLGGLAG